MFVFAYHIFQFVIIGMLMFLFSNCFFCATVLILFLRQLYCELFFTVAYASHFVTQYIFGFCLQLKIILAYITLFFNFWTYFCGSLMKSVISCIVI